MSKRAPYVPPVSLERLQAMDRALMFHTIAVDQGGAPLSEEMAYEIQELINLVEAGPRVRRADAKDMERAAMVRWMIDRCRVPQNEALQAIYGKRTARELEILARSYRNRAALLSRPPECVHFRLTAALLEQVYAAYFKTDSYKRRKGKTGKLKRK